MEGDIEQQERRVNTDSAGNLISALKHTLQRWSLGEQKGVVDLFSLPIDATVSASQNLNITTF
jgi:hypothetical protein